MSLDCLFLSLSQRMDRSSSRPFPLPVRFLGVPFPGRMVPFFFPFPCILDEAQQPTKPRRLAHKAQLSANAILASCLPCFRLHAATHEPLGHEAHDQTQRRLPSAPSSPLHSNDKLNHLHVLITWYLCCRYSAHIFDIVTLFIPINIY